MLPFTLLLCAWHNKLRLSSLLLFFFLFLFSYPFILKHIFPMPLDFVKQNGTRFRLFWSLKHSHFHTLLFSFLIFISVNEGKPVKTPSFFLKSHSETYNLTFSSLHRRFNCIGFFSVFSFSCPRSLQMVVKCVFDSSHSSF